MSHRSLDTREDIDALVRAFYTSVKKDELLGPIFNNAENFSWEVHIPIMVDFWESLLLGTGAYKGNAMRKHIDLHQRTPLTPQLFARWKQLFYHTLDTQFTGPNVAVAKNKVESIAGLMEYKIQESDRFRLRK
jgi:hemoglobin